MLNFIDRLPPVKVEYFAKSYHSSMYQDLEPYTEAGLELLGSNSTMVSTSISQETISQIRLHFYTWQK